MPDGLFRQILALTHDDHEAVLIAGLRLNYLKDPSMRLAAAVGRVESGVSLGGVEVGGSPAGNQSILQRHSSGTADFV